MNYLTRLLKTEHKKAGLYLEETENLLYLMFGQRRLGKWKATYVNFEEVHDTADMFLAMEAN